MLIIVVSIISLIFTLATASSESVSSPTSLTSSWLTQKHHSQITQCLTSLKKEELVNVGLRLGLRYPTLKKMSPDTILNDMVHAWLRRDDDVIEGSGEPSWESLSKALEDCGHKGIASDIKIDDILSTLEPIG